MLVPNLLPSNANIEADRIRMWMRLACIPLFIAACALLSVGAFFLFFGWSLHWHDLGFSPLLFGDLPAFSGAVLLLFVSWLSSRANGSKNLPRSVAKVFLSAVCVTTVFWILWATINSIRLR